MFMVFDGLQSIIWVQQVIWLSLRSLVLATLSLYIKPVLLVFNHKFTLKDIEYIVHGSKNGLLYVWFNLLWSINLLMSKLNHTYNNY